MARRKWVFVSKRNHGFVLLDKARRPMRDDEGQVVYRESRSTALDLARFLGYVTARSLNSWPESEWAAFDAKEKERP